MVLASRRLPKAIASLSESQIGFFMLYSQKQKEFLESFSLNPKQMTTYQVFATIHWIKKTNPTKEQINKLQAKLDGRTRPNRQAQAGVETRHFK